MCVCVAVGVCGGGEGEGGCSLCICEHPSNLTRLVGFMWRRFEAVDLLCLNASLVEVHVTLSQAGGLFRCQRGAVLCQ